MTFFLHTRRIWQDSAKLLVAFLAFISGLVSDKENLEELDSIIWYTKPMIKKTNLFLPFMTIKTKKKKAFCSLKLKLNHIITSLIWHWPYTGCSEEKK